MFSNDKYDIWKRRNPERGEWRGYLQGVDVASLCGGRCGWRRPTDGCVINSTWVIFASSSHAQTSPSPADESLHRCDKYIGLVPRGRNNGQKNEPKRDGVSLFFLSFSVSVVVRLTFERYYVECSSYSKVEQTEFITKATGRKVVFLFFTKFPPWGWLIWPHLIRLLLHLKCWNSITLLLWVWCCLCFLWYTDLRAKQTQLKNPQ